MTIQKKHIKLVFLKFRSNEYLEFEEIIEKTLKQIGVCMEKEFIQILKDSQLLIDISEKIKKVDLPNYYIGAGEIVQTI